MTVARKVMNCSVWVLNHWYGQSKDVQGSGLMGL